MQGIRVESSGDNDDAGKWKTIDGTDQITGVFVDQEAVHGRCQSRFWESPKEMLITVSYILELITAVTWMAKGSCTTTNAGGWPPSDKKNSLKKMRIQQLFKAWMIFG